jgi:heat shock protein HslJ
MKSTAFSLSLLLALAACSTADKPDSKTENARMVMGAAVPLVGTNWVLTKVGETSAVVGAGQREPFLQLQAADGRISGFAGCNMFTGPYQLSGDSLSFGPLAMTRMACPPPGMTLEGGYANALRDTKAYKIAGSQLTLSDSAGKALANFVAK